MIVHILTLFPDVIVAYVRESLIHRATEKKLLRVDVHNIREFADIRGKKSQVDERPFGGGPGMVLRSEPIYRAVQYAKRISRKAKRTRVILFSLRGKPFSATVAKRLSKYDSLILICGRYEGVDERVARYVADEEISMGEYVLSGGELPALTLLEATARFLPGFLGNPDSLEENSGSYPVYTRPPVVEIEGKKRAVPKVLLSGDHAAIMKFRNIDKKKRGKASSSVS